MTKDKSIAVKMSTGIPLAIPWLTKTEIDFANEALNSSWISSKGKFIDEIEKSSYFTGRDGNILVANGTLALVLALETLIGRKGSNVLVPNHTFAATANSVVQSNNLPIFYPQKIASTSIEPDYDSIEKLLCMHSIAALIVVHLYGECVDLTKARRFCEKYELILIEDCAEAPFSKDIHGNQSGSVGHAAAFSFFANKVITSGEGGLVSFKNEHDQQCARQIRDHGMSPLKKYYHTSYGSNYRMTNVQAAILYGQLTRLDSIILQRKTVLESYCDNLPREKGFIMPRTQEGSVASPWFCVFALNREFYHMMGRYDNLLIQKQVEFRHLFEALVTQPAFQSYPRFSIEDDMIRGYMLPMHHNLNEAIIKSICECFID